MTRLLPRNFKELISPEDAVALFQYATMEDVQIVKTLYDVYREHEGTDKNRLWDLISLMTFAYDTGRVQGIREERAKRKGAIA